MIQEIRKKLKSVQSQLLNGGQLNIKDDEITFIDHNHKLVYKRVFRSDLNSVQLEVKNLPVAQIKESFFSQNSSEFILDYIDGSDVFTHLKLQHQHREKTLMAFEDFLSSWMGFSNDCNYLRTMSFDINPGNFIINPETFEIRKIDYLSDWGPTQLNLYSYLLPFIKLIKCNLIDEEVVRGLINKRFSPKKLNYDQLLQELQTNFSNISTSIS